MNSPDLLPLASSSRPACLSEARLEIQPFAEAPEHHLQYLNLSSSKAIYQPPLLLLSSRRSSSP
jgi:hypothetical protein